MNKGAASAIQLRKSIGICDANEIPLETVILALGGLLEYKPMRQADGRIVHGPRISTIQINSNIEYEGKKRFVLAHELGHLIMHKDYPVHDDSSSLEWFNDTVKQLKFGIKENEANQFASEYLMPMNLFKIEALGKIFSPELLRFLSEKFKTSLTSSAFRYFESDIRPMALFHIFNGIVRYWRKSEDLKVWIEDITKLPPPPGSVAMEYIEAGYEPIYRKKDLCQEISKSTWFRLAEDEDDSLFYEYCIVTKKYRSILSIVWED